MPDFIDRINERMTRSPRYDEGQDCPACHRTLSIRASRRMQLDRQIDNLFTIGMFMCMVLGIAFAVMLNTFVDVKYVSLAGFALGIVVPYLILRKKHKALQQKIKDEGLDRVYS